MINKATILGRIGRKEFRTLPSGGPVCNMSVATTKKYNDQQGQKREVTTWHNINFFNKIADIANRYAHVGDIIYVEGEIINKKVDQNGTSKIFTSITAYDIKFLPQGKKQQNEGHEPNGNIVPDEEAELDDDIPF